MKFVHRPDYKKIAILCSLQKLDVCERIKITLFKCKQTRFYVRSFSNANKHVFMFAPTVHTFGLPTV